MTMLKQEVGPKTRRGQGSGRYVPDAYIALRQLCSSERHLFHNGPILNMPLPSEVTQYPSDARESRRAVIF